MYAVTCERCHERVCEVDRVRAEDEARLRAHLALRHEDIRSDSLGELLHHFSFACVSRSSRSDGG